MCKRWPLGAMLLTLMIITGCANPMHFGDGDLEAYQRLHHKFSRMESYTASVRLTVKSNKTEEVYSFAQTVRSHEEAELVLHEPEKLAGLKTTFSEGQVSLSTSEGEPAVFLSEGEDVDYTFLHNFFSIYYQSEDTAIETGGAASGAEKTMLLETETVPKTSRRHSMSLLVDTKTLTPRVLTVYDMGGNVTLQAEYSDFQYNPF